MAPGVPELPISRFLLATACRIKQGMKIALFGITEIKPGKHNLKDPRLDQVDKLVEADKKTTPRST